MSQVPDQEAVRQVLIQLRRENGEPLLPSEAIEGIHIRSGDKGARVQIALRADPSLGPAIEDMRQSAERAIAAMPGVLEVTAMLTASGPAEKAPSPAPQRKPATTGQQKPDGVAHVIAVASGKGGVGKSMIAVNLAVALGAVGHRAGLLDADVYGPSVPRMLALEGAPEVIEGTLLRPREAFGIKAMSMGLLVPEEKAMIWRGPMAQGALQKMLTDIAWAPLDFLIIDMPPGTGDIQITLSQRVALSGAVIVSTPQDIALADARKAMAMFDQVQVPIAGIVENMAYFEAPDTGAHYEIFGRGGARAEAEKRGVTLLGEVPLTIPLRENADAGWPIAAALPDSTEAALFRDMATRLAEGVMSADRKPPPQIVFV